MLEVVGLQSFFVFVGGTIEISTTYRDEMASGVTILTADYA